MARRRVRRDPFRWSWSIGAEGRLAYFATLMVGLPIVVWIVA